MHQLFRSITALSAFFCVFICPANALPGTYGTTTDTALPVTDLHLRWNNAHNQPDSLTLLQLFDKNVLYYGSRMPREKLVVAKMKFFRKTPGYSQAIQQVNFLVNNNYQKEIRFMKLVSAEGNVMMVPARLKIVKKENGWVITEESDSISDARLEAGNRVPENAVAGDFNGDGKKDHVWLLKPIVKEGEMDCEGNCNAQLLLSVPGSRPYIIENCIGSDPVNLGDLDGNGTDEIGMLHDWFTSCWKAYYVFTLKNKKWQRLIPPVSTHCTQWEEDEGMPVKKHPQKKGHLLVRYSVITDEGIEVKTKTVKLK